MTTIDYTNNGTALFFVAIVTPDGAVAHDRLARFGLVDISRALNQEEFPTSNQRFFPTKEKRDAFIVNHNKEASE